MASSPLQAHRASFNLSNAIAAGTFPKLETRDQVEDMIEQLLAVLDAADGDPDHEEDNVDCCEAYDDRPYSFGTFGNDWSVGDPDDAENSDG
ncbi:hypothetical protein [Allopontixanthobacter sediminis]|uniref:Uncharacterized protein n=1 Tax=Allopontixanthobacter sediminis TaxID=1689985 RepID=A0A845B7T4_9SPHN|nr:hypothetical protein [Allopontixanthobacter sediminis]MXP43689.1 hypothetical protein [Allopontixanthobacter sediminis]